MIGARGAQAQLVTPQFDCQEYFVTVESDGTLPVANEGNSEVTVVRNGTGDYSITLVTPGERLINVRAPMPFTSGLSFKIVTATATTVRIAFDDDTVATDTKFMIGIVVSYDNLRRS